MYPSWPAYVWSKVKLVPEFSTPAISIAVAGFVPRKALISLLDFKPVNVIVLDDKGYKFAFWSAMVVVVKIPKRLTFCDVPELAVNLTFNLNPEGLIVSALNGHEAL